jgi:hypothetical protein
MPTYTIEGKKVTTDAPLSDQEIDEIAVSLREEPGVGNLLKQGFAGDVGLVTGLGSTLTTLPRTSPDGQERGFMDEFTQAYQQGYEKALEMLGGVPTPESRDLATRAYESGVRAVGAPSTYIMRGVTPAKVGVRGAGGAYVGALSEVTGEAGSAIEKATTGEDTGVGRMVGALAAPVPSTALKMAVSPSLKDLKNKWSEFRSSAKDSGEYYATGAAKRLLDRAASEIGLENIEEIVNDFNAIGNTISKSKYPLLVSLSDNPALRQQAIRLAKTNPDFRKKAQDELTRIAFDIDANANKIFGEQFAPTPKGDVTSIKNVEKRVAAIDNKISELSSKLTPDVSKEQTGQAIANLVEAKKAAIKGQLQPEYTALMTEARANNVVMPSEGVQSVYNFIKENNIRDIFGKGTAVDSQIMRVWAKGEAVPFDQVDSLKRRINDLQRKPLSPTEARNLYQLEDILDQARQTIPGDFNDKLKALDLSYYERIGVPFGATGIKDIDAKKYAEQVAPVLTSNASALRQFLKATDNEGVDVARNAILSEVYYKTVKDGKVNLGALNKYVKDKSEVISQIPGLREELLSSAADQRQLLLKKEQLENAYKVQEKRLADNFITQYGKDPDYTALTNSLVNNRRKLDTFFTDLKQTSPEVSKAVVNNVRREFLQQALDNPDGAVNYLTSPRNKYLVEKMFGSGYQKKVEDLAKLTDALSKADLSRVGDAVTATELDALAKIVPGLDIPYVSSNFRDRISSLPQKIIRILSRVQTASLKTATDDAIAKLLLDPEGLTQLQNAAKGMDLKNLTLGNKRKLLETMAAISPSYFYIAGKSGVEEEREAPPSIEMGEFY